MINELPVIVAMEDVPVLKEKSGEFLKSSLASFESILAESIQPNYCMVLGKNWVNIYRHVKEGNTYSFLNFDFEDLRYYESNRGMLPLLDTLVYHGFVQGTLVVVPVPGYTTPLDPPTKLKPVVVSLSADGDETEITTNDHLHNFGALNYCHQLFVFDKPKRLDIYVFKPMSKN